MKSKTSTQIHADATFVFVEELGKYSSFQTLLLEADGNDHLTPNYLQDLAELKYFTNLDFPEVKEFPETSTGF